MKRALKFLTLSFLSSCPLPSLATSDSSVEEASGIIAEALEGFTGHYSANDYLCGSVIVSMQPGWRILKAKITNGSIQNQFQFNRSASAVDLYTANRFSTNQLQVKQLTGYLGVGNIYWSENPIEFTLHTLHIESGQKFDFQISKGVCSMTQVGEVEVTQVNPVSNNPIEPYVKNAEQDDLTYFYHYFKNSFFTPAYVIIPSPDVPVQIQ